MLSKDEWDEIDQTEFVSVKGMLIIVVLLSIFVQSVAQLFVPSFWINYQLLAFILATNVGAVVLAMMAQSSADKISRMYRRAFTPEFYQGLGAITKVFNSLEAQAEANGQDLSKELESLGPRLYGFLFSDRPDLEPPVVEVEPSPEWSDESELFA
tara:strand:- start:483 stop:947 length:465 start_codon:yes stop_codon:yes gene_type:complete